MILSLRIVVERIPLKFSSGNSDVLKLAMLKDDNDFLRFSGKDQFDKKVKILYPEINIHDLYCDYYYNFRKAMAILRFCQQYENCKKGKVVVKFVYKEGIDPLTGKIVGEDFKILDGIIRPFKDKFWNKYLPPNYHGDQSCLSYVYNEEITSIPRNVEHIKSLFYCDLSELFFNEIDSGNMIMPNCQKSSTSITYKIDVTKPVISALKEYIKGKI